ncbi:zinc finger protein 883-like isoform X3 [Euwallacea fornicatus]|uniref:zinc finger protein 883-like isoform X3 n=1 Tax=Euwallacea fornicatus TaxID=995702 RepID=UPI00338E4968
MEKAYSLVDSDNYGLNSPGTSHNRRDLFEPVTSIKEEDMDNGENGTEIISDCTSSAYSRFQLLSKAHLQANILQHSKHSSEHSSDLEEESDCSTVGEDTQCDICQKIFLDTEDLNIHISSRRTDNKRYQCCNCKKTFRDNTQLKVHARKHTGEKPFECKVCHKKFTVNGNLNKHMRIHTGEKRFECTDCGKKFTQFAHLEDHKKTHSGERPFICQYCHSTFKTKARLRKHEKSHCGIVPVPPGRAVKCIKCGAVFAGNRQLGVHLATHVPDSVGPFMCHLCGKVFSKYPNLQEHQKTHMDTKSFFCELCDKKFSSGTHLRRHMNSHSGFRPFSCNICNRPFPSSQNLKRHMMTHTGERPFDCTECGKKFLTQENLNRHMRTHTGEKPFACEICGKVFAHSTTAKEHYRAVHTEEKPYKCAVCKTSFSLSKILYKHVRVKHPEFFPQFKKEQNLTPNMKKAINKIRKGIKCEDDNIKVEFDLEEGKFHLSFNAPHKTIFPGLEEPIPILKLNEPEVSVKIEPSEETEATEVNSKETKEIRKETAIGIEKSSLPKVKDELNEGDSSALECETFRYIKTEKIEVDD